MAATIPAGEFKAKCLKLLDEVAEKRETLVITKHGKPVAQVVPMPAVKELFGAMRGAGSSSATSFLPWKMSGRRSSDGEGRG